MLICIVVMEAHNGKNRNSKDLPVHCAKQAGWHFPVLLFSTLKCLYVPDNDFLLSEAESTLCVRGNHVYTGCVLVTFSRRPFYVFLTEQTQISLNQCNCLHLKVMACAFHMKLQPQVYFYLQLT